MIITSSYLSLQASAYFCYVMDIRVSTHFHTSVYLAEDHTTELPTEASFADIVEILLPRAP